LYGIHLFSFMLVSTLKDLKKAEYRRLIDRGKADFEAAIPRVEPILEAVKREGDRALRRSTKKFDGADIRDFRVTEEEFRAVRKEVGPEVKRALKTARKNIAEFHRAQMPKAWSFRKGGATLGQLPRPLERVGCYVPGGRAVYPSTVLMTVVPAKVAGVKEVACVTPPTKEGGANPYTLVAAEIAGTKEVYKLGGAQAIAALAYGTETIPKVEKIVGPGNVFVAAAKWLLKGEVAVDNPAGPSEVLIIADSTAKADFIAHDMAAQAEHDPLAKSVLVTTSRALAGQVEETLEELRFKREETRRSLDANSAILVAKNMAEAVEFSNRYAPEHLQIMTKDPRKVLRGIKSAGSVFLGDYTPVALGDYASGTNHVLPTGGFARVYSGLGTYDFLKFVTYQQFSRKALESLAPTVITLAEAEGLVEHAESVRKRLE
jgi:histidinol dehydrogenase